MLIFLLLSIIIITIYIVYQYKNYEKNNFLLKFLASLSFVIFGVYVWLTGSKEYSIFVCIGLIFGLLGDLILEQKRNYLNHKDFCLNGGFLLFSINHIFNFLFLVLSVLALTKINVLYFFLSLVLGAFASLVFILTMSKFKIKMEKHVYTAFAYSTILASTFFFGVLFYQQLSLIMILGLLIFLTTDIILCLIYFGKLPLKIEKKLSILNLIFYYGA